MSHIQVHRHVVERSEVVQEERFDRDGNSLGFYAVRCRWTEIASVPARPARTYQPAALQRARKRYSAQPLNDVPSYGWVLMNGEVFFAPARGMHVLEYRQRAKGGDFSARPQGNTVSVRAAKRAAKKARAQS